MSDRETANVNLDLVGKRSIKSVDKKKNKEAQQESNELLLSGNTPFATGGAATTECKAGTSEKEKCTPPSVENNCRICNSEDDSRMVQCDNCDGWYHFACVGVSQEIEHQDWICTECESAKSSQENALGAKKKTVLKSKPLQTKEEDIKQKVTVGDVFLELHDQNQKQSRKSLKEGSVTSGLSKKSAKTLLTIQLQKIEAEEALMKEEIRRKRELIEKKFSVLEEIAEIESETKSAGVPHTSSMVKVKEWLNDDQAMNTADREAHGDEDLCDSDNDAAISGKGEEACEDGSQHNLSGQQVRISVNLNSIHLSDRLQITREQIAARQVVPRDLPKFSGNPDDWPMFFSTYESTTTMCGYRDEENMIRLRNCLKDEALAAVRSFLMHPSTVSKAIAALKLRFGQPHTIIRCLEEKILAMPPIKGDSLDRLIDFALSVQNLCATIDACGTKEYMKDVTLLHELINKLTSSLKLDWARYQRTLSKVNLAIFNKWIYTLAEDACAVTEPHSNHKGKVFLNAHSEEPAVVEERSSIGESIHNARVAAATHAKSSNSSPFELLPRGSNTDVIKNAQCAKADAQASDYVISSRDCHMVYSTRDENMPKVPQTTQRRLQWQSLWEKWIQSSRESEHDLHTHQTVSSGGLFRYVPVELYGARKHIRCYAFLDDGSALTLMDQQIADDLELFGAVSPLCLRWTGGTHRYEANSQIVSVDISGCEGKKYHLREVRTVGELQLPYQSLDMEELQRKHPYLSGLPINSYHEVRPRILIGLKHANITLVRRSREGQQGEPIAVKTNLGWTVFGVMPAEQSTNMVHYTYHICSCDGVLQQAVKDYFSLDSLGIAKLSHTFSSNEDERALSLLNSLTRCMGERFETGLLWRYDDVRLPDSRPMALKRAKCLRSRMTKNPQLADSLNNIIAEYQSKGYIRKVSQSELVTTSQRVWYLPIFPVFNPNKPGKLRIVWDAAAPVHGTSLNSVLLTGPDQLTSLISVLQKFREHRFAICGDILEMFHQVSIRKEDQQCQRFLWYEGDEQEPSTFVMQVTFGACCSPSAAQFVKNKNAKRFEVEFPRAAAAIMKNHYVDDWLASAETEEETIELARAVRHVHAKGGFEMRNWVSNSPKILSALCERPTGSKDLNLGAALAAEKVLGMWWDTSTDSFAFKICWTRLDHDLRNGCRRPTKREMLRILMTIFDP
ncbi:uncharacterized protein LOC129773142 [Toxorhynchites rutilus septentrionalis]|uniref:uncharacterized protein LOC129773142 n=1 Tax=Toxorhynchites rutilus septentrionalis TaxID=329112 RepID=UPI002478DA9C|nr:uncharacterized protein LOC129773142 [Toxorhynchites rutilus septentrionalis]